MQIRSLTSHILPQHGHYRRVSVRPLCDRQPGFDALHDETTLIYDTFLNDTGDRIVLVLPPLHNLREPFTQSQFFVGPDQVMPLIRPLTRCVRMVLPSSGSDRVTIEGPLGKIRLVPQPNHSSLFKGKRVILTMSKDNDLAWIKYWVDFNVRVHGANAVLIYDNGSTKYTLDELDRLLTGIQGIEQAVVVDWPFLWGPVAGPQGTWDSNYSQHGMFEDARWRFLGAAKGVLNSDVDELVVITPHHGLFNMLEAAPTGYLNFDGVWISTARDAERGGLARCHNEFKYVNTLESGCERKWAVVPRLCLPRSQWKIHEITDMANSQPGHAAIKLRHFRAINTNWRCQRTMRERLDPGLHQRDEALVAAMAKLG